LFTPTIPGKYRFGLIDNRRHRTLTSLIDGPQQA
jgi:hypothetical protein